MRRRRAYTCDTCPRWQDNGGEDDCSTNIEGVVCLVAAAAALICWALTGAMSLLPDRREVWQLLQTVDDAEGDLAQIIARYRASDPIFDALASRDTVLVKGSWLLNECTQICRRQDLPSEAVWDPAELREQQKWVDIVAISYCWIDPSHPDPEGEHLVRLKDMVRVRLRGASHDRQSDLALFFDYMSMHQRGPDKKRTLAEERSFQRALKHVSLWYAHQSTEVWLLTRVPRESTQYDERGWPFFECAVSSMITDPRKLLDISAADPRNGQDWDWASVKSICRMRMRPPILPEEFARMLQNKRFTNGADRAFVTKKYKQAFEEVLGPTQELRFTDLRWGEDEATALAKVLPHCYRLERLHLTGNQMSGDAVKCLVMVAAQCGALKLLDIRNNPISQSDGEHLLDLWSQKKDPIGFKFCGAVALQDGVPVTAQRTANGSALCDGSANGREYCDTVGITIQELQAKNCELEDALCELEAKNQALEAQQRDLECQCVATLSGVFLEQRDDMPLLNSTAEHFTPKGDEGSPKMQKPSLQQQEQPQPLHSLQQEAQHKSSLEGQHVQNEPHPIEAMQPSRRTAWSSPDGSPPPSPPSEDLCSAEVTYLAAPQQLPKPKKGRRSSSRDDPGSNVIQPELIGAEV